jgi:VanZ family protein
LFPPPWDKLVHATFFFALTLLLEAGFILPPRLIALTAMAIGMADEIHQLWLPGRTACLADWLTDVVGVSLAVLGVFILQRRRAPDRTGQAGED